MFLSAAAILVASGANSSSTSTIPSSPTDAAMFAALIVSSLIRIEMQTVWQHHGALQNAPIRAPAGAVRRCHDIYMKSV
jgi:hypothetical protein